MRKKLSSVSKYLRIGSLTLAGLFYLSSAHAENGTLSAPKFASCGKTECVTINNDVAYTSLMTLIIDFPNAAVKIKNKSGKEATYNAQDVFYDSSKIVLRNVAELNGRDAIYDLETEQFSHF